MDKTKLVCDIKNGDQLAFKLIYEEFYEPLLAYITTFTRNRQDAKDIVQNCFIILWNKRKDLADDSSLKSYLFTVAHNLYINQYKKDLYRSRVLDELKFKALNNRIDESRTITEARIERMTLLIENLPPRCKQIFLMSKREGKKYIEISTLLNISSKTVESQMRIAYQKIRDGFQKDKLVIFLCFKKIRRHFISI
ncbi:MAG: RNA polymerase sigma-70 factor [Maribacter sp.]|nr:MAG: RNA polymerase sigma-70 factor [Maribacter sp.]